MQAAKLKQPSQARLKQNRIMNQIPEHLHHLLLKDHHQVQQQMERHHVLPPVNILQRRIARQVTMKKAAKLMISLENTLCCLKGS